MILRGASPPAVCGIVAAVCMVCRSSLQELPPRCRASTGHHFDEQPERGDEEEGEEEGVTAGSDRHQAGEWGEIGWRRCEAGCYHQTGPGRPTARFRYGVRRLRRSGSCQWIRSESTSDVQIVVFGEASRTREASEL